MAAWILLSLQWSRRNAGFCLRAFISSFVLKAIWNHYVPDSMVVQGAECRLLTVCMGILSSLNHPERLFKYYIAPLPGSANSDPDTWVYKSMMKWFYFWRASGTTCYSEQGHLQQVAQDKVQVSLEYLKGWRLHNLSGQSFPVFSYPHSNHSDGTSCDSVCVLCFWSSHWATLGRVRLCLL